MVEMITQYRAEDGKLFGNSEEAESYERGIEPGQLAAALCELSQDLMRDIILSPTAPGNSRFADALERAAYLVAGNRRAAGVFKRAPKGQPEGAAETGATIGEGSQQNADDGDGDAGDV